MKELTAAELKDWIKEGRAFRLVDVREPYEHEAYNIGGALIPMGELMSRRGELAGGEPVVLYCEKGIRSVIAIQRLEAMGYGQLYNLRGGMAAYRASL